MEDQTILNKKTIALLSTDGFEDSELQQPLKALQDAGAKVIIISDHDGEIKGKNGSRIDVDELVESIDSSGFDGLLLPGGLSNPDTMRQNATAVDFVRSFFESEKPVAAICHAPWLLVEAGVVSDRTLTSWPSLKTDIINAGGEWVDESVVVDRGLITSRKPDDLNDFCAKVIEEFSKAL